MTRKSRSSTTTIKAGIGLFFLCGCASLGHPADPPAHLHRSDLQYLEAAEPVAQAAYQCGPAALESVIRYWGGQADAQQIGERLLVRPGARAVLDFMLVQYAREQGFWTQTPEISSIEELRGWLKREIPPIVMVQLGPFGLPAYHFIVLKGFDDTSRVFYANTGQARTRAIPYAVLERRWRAAGYWTLILCPPERVNWALQPDDAVELRFLLANQYRRAGRLEEAKGLYRALLKERPDLGPAANNLAWIHLEEGRPQEALRTLEEAFRQGAQRRHDILDTAGLAYSRLHRTAQARAYYEEALQKAPPDDKEAKRVIRERIFLLQ